MILSQVVLRKLWVSLKDLRPIILVIAFFQIVVPGRHADEMQVYEIMTKPAVTVPAEMDIRYAIRLMQRIGGHRAPVQSGDRIVGMVTLSGIVLDSGLV
jgi:CBS domain-containing protein